MGFRASGVGFRVSGLGLKDSGVSHLKGKAKHVVEYGDTREEGQHDRHLPYTTICMRYTTKRVRYATTCVRYTTRWRRRGETARSTSDQGSGSMAPRLDRSNKVTSGGA